MSGKGIYDIHCHIVPGVDDGATDIEETGKLLRMEYEQGVRTITGKAGWSKLDSDGH